MKIISYKNNYLCDLIDKGIKKFLDKILTKKSAVSIVPKEDLTMVLSYLGKLSLQIHTWLSSIMKNKLWYGNVQFVSKMKCKISNFVWSKDRIPSFLRSGIVYKFQCGGCNATYYGKTKRHFKVWFWEHLRISALTGKRVKCVDNSAIKEHLLFCNLAPDFEDFSIQDTNNKNFKVALMDSLLINKDHHLLNKYK